MDRLGGIAVWLVLKPASAPPVGGPPKMQLHFNYWRMDDPSLWSQYNGHDYLDIGIWVERPQDVESAFIYVPLPLSDARIVDLAPRLADADTAQGIFNQILNATNSSGSDRWITLTNSAQRPFCRVHRFLPGNGAPSAQELQVAGFSSGTGITITQAAFTHSSSGLRASEALYFRLRLTINNRANPFLKTIRPKDRLFLSGFDAVEYIDFRMNEARTLPDDVEDAMALAGVHGPVELRALHFLVAIPVAADLIGGYPEPAKSRLLERQLWNRYVGDSLPTGMAIYHWKKTPDRSESSIKEFAVFVKLRIRRTGIRVLLAYLVVAFAFAIAGNLVASMVEPHAGTAAGTSPLVEEAPKEAPRPPVIAPPQSLNDRAKSPATNQQEESNAVAPDQPSPRRAEARSPSRTQR